MSLGPGTRLGPYEIVGPIGAGGMGEVYRARDGRLNRHVAIKILPTSLTSDPDRLSRFEREAQVLASLNHPNIASIHHVEETSDGPALVMEFIEGETLADRIAGGAIPIDEALPIARQISDALEAAHERGIVHRDLKPANIKVRPDGTVKVLDFGLAKMFDSDVVSAELSHSPTLVGGTITGVILGTAAYMSPEQARGHAVDKRTDIWAFGCVLYEMLTGRQAFEGGSATDIIASIIKSEPDWTRLPGPVSSRIRSLLRHCLQKDPRRRLHEIADARFQIDEIVSESTSSGDIVAAPAADRRRWWPGLVAVTGAIVAAATVIGFSLSGPRTGDRRVYEFEVGPPEKSVFSINTLTGAQAVPYPALSPDGRYLAFIAIVGEDRKQLLWTRPLDAKVAQPVAGSDGATTPFWSADSRYIGFFAGGKLKTAPIAGGPPQTLCDVGTLNLTGTWNKDGVILFSSGSTGTISRVSAAGGQPVSVTKLDASRSETAHWWPHFLPDGRHFLFFAQNSKPESRAVYIGSLDSGDSKLVLKGTTEAYYASPGYLLFMRDRNLMVQPFDAGRLEVSGDAFPVAEQLAGNPANGKVSLSVSDAGVLAYRTGLTPNNRQITWLDRAGNRVGTPGPVGNYLSPRLSRDGKRLAMTLVLEGGMDTDLWLMDVARGVPTRLTFDPVPESSAVWSPDGGRVAFRSQRNEMTQLYQKRSNGVGNADPLSNVAGVAIPQDWSTDGQYLVYATPGQGGLGDLWVLPLLGDQKAFAFLTTPFAENQAQVSPDGRWLAYRSNESGRFEIYVQSFPTPTGGKWQISSDGGIQPRWRGDGKELYYVGNNNRVMAVPITVGAGLEVGPAVALFALLGSTLDNYDYDVAADGQRFIVSVQLTEARNTPLTVVVDWTARLKK